MNTSNLRIQIPKNETPMTRTPFRRTSITKSPTAVLTPVTITTVTNQNNSPALTANIEVLNNKNYEISKMNALKTNTITRSRSSSLTKSNPVSVATTPVVNQRITLNKKSVNLFTGLNNKNKKTRRMAFKPNNANRIQKEIKNWNKPLKRKWYNPLTWSKTRKLRR